MGRHSGPADAALTIANIAAEPTQGSRRARVRAERAAAETQQAVVSDPIEKADIRDAFGQEVVTSIAYSEEALTGPVWPSREEFAASLTSETPISIKKTSSTFSFFERSHAIAAVLAVVVSAAGTVAMTSQSSSADTQTGADSLKVSARETLAQELETTFSVSVDGGKREVTTHKRSLGDALDDAGIVVNSSDVVSSAMAAPVVNGSSISITRISTQAVTETVTDPFATQEVDDDTLDKGTTKVETEGQDGIVTNTYDVTLKDGVEVSRVLSISAVTQARVDKVVHVGTKEKATPAASAASSASTSSAEAASSGGYVAPAGEAQQIAHDMIGGYGWGEDQFSCLVSLWNKESGWRVTAANPSGAYGIPQALPGRTMGAGWQTDASVQISWGLSYIAGRYGTPCGAWGAWQSKGWY